MRRDILEGTGKRLDSEFVPCPRCQAPMAIASISINAVAEQVTYRCEPCGTEKIVTNEDEWAPYPGPGPDPSQSSTNS